MTRKQKRTRWIISIAMMIIVVALVIWKNRETKRRFTPATSRLGKCIVTRSENISWLSQRHNHWMTCACGDSTFEVVRRANYSVEVGKTYTIRVLNDPSHEWTIVNDDGSVGL